MAQHTRGPWAFYNKTGVDGVTVQTCQKIIAAIANARGENP